MDTESGLQTWSGRIGTNFRNTVPASNFIVPSVPGFKELTVFLEIRYTGKDEKPEQIKKQCRTIV